MHLIDIIKYLTSVHNMIVKEVGWDPFPKGEPCQLGHLPMQRTHHTIHNTWRGLWIQYIHVLSMEVTSLAEAHDSN